jgi:hypothetical protein
MRQCAMRALVSESKQFMLAIMLKRLEKVKIFIAVFYGSFSID